MLDTMVIPQMTDDEVRRELANSEPESRVYLLLSDELNRRYLKAAGEAARDLSRSSGRVERLTWTLIALTVVLIVLAAPPAWDAAVSLIAH